MSDARTICDVCGEYEDECLCDGIDWKARALAAEAELERVRARRNKLGADLAIMEDGRKTDYQCLTGERDAARSERDEARARVAELERGWNRNEECYVCGVKDHDDGFCNCEDCGIALCNEHQWRDERLLDGETRCERCHKRLLTLREARAEADRLRGGEWCPYAYFDEDDEPEEGNRCNAPQVPGATECVNANEGYAEGWQRYEATLATVARVRALVDEWCEKPTLCLAPRSIRQAIDELLDSPVEPVRVTFARDTAGRLGLFDEDDNAIENRLTVDGEYLLIPKEKHD